jgi:hypothetical protein
LARHAVDWPDTPSIGKDRSRSGGGSFIGARGQPGARLPYNASEYEHEESVVADRGGRSENAATSHV